jgi:hypothetical protein
MQWHAFQGIPYLQLFLDLKKAYDAVDRDRLIDVLASYGFGPNVLRFLRHVWDNAQVVLRQMHYYGPPIPSRRGIWQGSILSPLFLNILIDCALRWWYYHLHTKVVGVFYADDGQVATALRPEVLQQAFELLLGFLE